MTALPAWRQRLAAVAVLMPHSFSVRLEPDDARWIRARSAVMAVHESNFHAPCCEACGKEWGKTVPTVPTAESDPFVMVLSELHVHPATVASGQVGSVTVYSDCEVAVSHFV